MLGSGVRTYVLKVEIAADRDGQSYNALISDQVGTDVKSVQRFVLLTRTATYPKTVS